MTRAERTFARDAALNERMARWDAGGAMQPNGWHAAVSVQHRAWGDRLYAADLDFTLVEYAVYGHAPRPAAIVEYKHCGAAPVDRDGDASIAVNRALADGALVPLFIAAYQTGPWIFRVWSGNAIAAEWVKPDGRYFSERAFVEMLYRVRGQPLDAGLLNLLDGLSVARRGELDARLAAWEPLDYRQGAQV